MCLKNVKKWDIIKIKADKMDESFLSGLNTLFLEEQLKLYTENPAQVSPTTAAFFQTNNIKTILPQTASWGGAAKITLPNGEMVSAFDGNWTEEQTKERPTIEDHAKQFSISSEQAAHDSINALKLIQAYRENGHRIAQLDPLQLQKRVVLEELKPSHYGFSAEDMDKPIYIQGIFGYNHASINEIMAILTKTYCQMFAVEFCHITNSEERVWLQNNVEPPSAPIHFTENGKKAILKKLIEAECFEKVLGKKYTGTKRFGLDGGESLLPGLEQIIKRGGKLGLKEIVLGMPHRGRLNILCNVMGKDPQAIFHEFKGGAPNPDDVEGSGDVKYHLGCSADRNFDGNNVHLSLCANPSHLEAVNPVALGKARAKQDKYDDVDKRRSVLALLLHGDAAFAGQGITAECLGLSGLKGHRTGGSVHFIVNNQIGFTTNPLLSRSSSYCSDVAKMIEAPIFHVNADDPESVVFAARLAIEYRQKFGKPVVVDMTCYRRFGHNEGDEPMFTQPRMYNKIAKHPTTLDLYSQRLVDEGVVTTKEYEATKQEYINKLEEDYYKSDNYQPQSADWLEGRWANIKKANAVGARRGITAVDEGQFRRIADTLTKLPQNLDFHRVIIRNYNKRHENLTKGKHIDWATAEMMAFGTLINDGFSVRLSGQDCERGTFSQRHSVLVCQTSEERYTPLERLKSPGANYEVINSMLSEEAVLGFEYGYSLAEPNALILWEAQFGDFANGAQVIVDQFISSAERKWLRMSGLVMLLPHGYEGQGPEHSSARLERYLQICAEDNMQVANCTTPSNYFHILRRQLCRDFRKPLILMTPKSLLRHKKVVSTIEEFTGNSTFHRILWDDAEMNNGLVQTQLVEHNKIRRVVLCSGKVYFDLVEKRDQLGIKDIYFLRLEQLYPFPHVVLEEELARFKNAEIMWCQEEPRNMGAWNFILPLLIRILENLKKEQRIPLYAGRDEFAATATGLMKKHLSEIDSFMEQVFA